MRLFITGTNTGVGKTHITLKLIELAASMGLRPGCFKPIETGVLSSPADGSKLLSKCQEFNKNFSKVMISDVVPYAFELPAAPYVAKKDIRIDIDSICKKAQELESLCDILFIEGAGGLMVPIELDYFMLDLIKELKSHALLISPSRLGSINDTLLSQMALENAGVEFSWYINLFEDADSFNDVTMPYYRDRFKEVPLNLKSVFQSYLDSYVS